MDQSPGACGAFRKRKKIFFLKVRAMDFKKNRPG